MFDFEQLSVYKKALTLNKKIFNFIKDNNHIDLFLQNQLKRATVSIVLNIAEGNGRFTVPDRRRFFVISRGSAFEVIAVMQVIKNLYSIDLKTYNEIRIDTEEISKMLFSLIKKVTIKTPLETRARP
jgi:four helix bundle protein